MGTQGKRPAAQVAVLLLMTCVLLHGGESGRKPSAPLKRIPLKALVVGPRTTELETIFEKGSLKDHEILVRWTLSEPAVSMLSTAFEPAPGNSNGWLCRGKWQAKATCSLSVHVSDGTRLLCLNETTTTSGGVQDVSKTKRAAEQEAGKRARIVWAPKELRQVAALALAKKLHTSSVMANYAAGRGRAGGLSLVKCSSGRSAARIRIVIGQGNSDAGARRDRGKLEALSQVLGRAFRTKVADVSVAQDAGNRLWDETIIKVETHSERFPDIEPWVFSFKANVLVSTARDVRRFEAQTSWVHERAGTKMMNSIPVVGGVFGVFAFTGEVLVEIYSLGAVPAAKRRLASRKSVPALAENLFVQIWTDPDFQAFIRDVDEKKTEPAALDLKVSFDDTRGLLPNNRIDAGETCALQVRATNRGEGTAFGVCLKVASSNADVSAQEDMPLGDIVPQGSEQATVSLVATTSLATGTTEFLITAEDRRGFSATPIRLEVPTAAMAPPTLSIDSCAMGDAGGLAKGDGDGTAENGETLELTPCIANSGLGEALQVSVSLCEVTPGIDVVHGQRVLPAVAPGRVGKATLSLCIPRTFADTELRYTIVAKDVRGITARRTFTVPLVARRPGVELSCRILDRQGRAVTRMENGRGFRMIIALRNTGDISAEDVQLEVGSLAEGVTFERQRATVGSLAHNAPSTEMALPVSLDKTFAGDVVRFTVTATQRGFGPAVQEFSFPVRCLRPQLKARITLLGAAGSPMLLQNTRPTLRLSVANNGDLDAAEVAAHVELTHAGIDLDRRVALGTIQAGRECYRDFSFFVRSDAVPGPVTATVVVTQATFPGKSMGFPCRVERQEAIVQRVGGVTTLAVAPPAKRDVPPEIYIVSPNDGATIYAETAALIGTIITFGKDNVPEKLTVALDGRPVSVKRIQQEPGSPVPVDHAYAWPAGEGKTMFRGTLAFNLGRNEIRIAVVDRNGRRCESRVQVERQQRLGEIRAVVIGIDSFRSFPPEAQLTYAESDAERFWEFLGTERGGGLPLEQRRLLTGSQTPRAAVIAALTEFLGQAGKEDTVILYLATHGLVDETDGALYLACHDTDPGNLLGTGLSDRDLTHILTRRIAAGKVVIYLDACHSALSGLSTRYAKRGIVVRATNTGISRLALKLSARQTGGVHTFTAVSAEGVAREHEEWGGGLYTDCLLLGLEGAADRDDSGWVDVGELDRYLSREVYRRSGGKQAPKAYGTLPLDTPLSSVR